ncbi:MAG: hypothetical protein WCV91_00845 [Candidatus Margulisiibacteriota bacterium]
MAGLGEGISALSSTVTSGEEGIMTEIAGAGYEPSFGKVVNVTQDLKRYEQLAALGTSVAKNAQTVCDIANRQ